MSSQSETNYNSETDLDIEIGRRVHQRMWDKHVKQNEIALALGIDQTAVSKKNRGTQAYSTKQLVAVARKLETSVAYLVGEIDSPNGVPVGPTGFEPMTSTV